jgi:hypothetical protein
MDGFTEFDPRYVYRRHQASSGGAILGAVAQAGLSYFVDGVVGFDGPAVLGCTAGDMRVHWQVRRFSPSGISVVGELSAGRSLVPFLCDRRSTDGEGTRKLLAYPSAKISLDDMLWAVLHSAKAAAWWHRLYSALLASGSLVLLYLTMRPAKDCDKLVD